MGVGYEREVPQKRDMGIHIADSGFPKNLPAMQETQVGSLDQEDPLEKEMTTHSNIFAWEIPWTEESGGLQSMQKSRTGLSD